MSSHAEDQDDCTTVPDVDSDDVKLSKRVPMSSPVVAVVSDDLEVIIIDEDAPLIGGLGSGSRGGGGGSGGGGGGGGGGSGTGSGIGTKSSEVDIGGGGSRHSGSEGKSAATAAATAAATTAAPLAIPLAPPAMAAATQGVTKEGSAAKAAAGWVPPPPTFVDGRGRGRGGGYNGGGWVSTEAAFAAAATAAAAAAAANGGGAAGAKRRNRPTGVLGPASDEAAYKMLVVEAAARSGVEHTRETVEGTDALAAQQAMRLAAAKEEMNAQLAADRLRRTAQNRLADLGLEREREIFTAAAVASKRAREGESGGGGGGGGGAGATAPPSTLSSYEDSQLDVETAICVALGCIETPFTVLGLAAHAPQEAIRRRWLLLSRLLHPDRIARSTHGVAETARRRAEEAYKNVARAYGQLCERAGGR